jgi:hypothetical protein
LFCSSSKSSSRKKILTIAAFYGDHESRTEKCSTDDLAFYLGQKVLELMLVPRESARHYIKNLDKKMNQNPRKYESLTM